MLSRCRVEDHAPLIILLELRFVVRRMTGWMVDRCDVVSNAMLFILAEVLTHLQGWKN